MTTLIPTPKHRIPEHSGFTVIELLAVLAIVGTLIGLLIPAVQRVRESGRQAQCSNNEKNIGLAIAHYQQARKLFPAGNEQVTGRFHAWSSYILPFMEQSDVASRIDFTKPWDDPGGNAAIADLNVPTYVCPSGMMMFPGKQDYGGVLGAWIDADGNVPTTGDFQHSGVLYATDQAVSRPASPAAIVDGLSHTLLVAEASDREHIGAETRKAGDSCWACGSNCFPLSARVLNVPDFNGFQSKHPNGLFGLFADGHVVYLNDRTDGRVLIAICTKSGGETDSPDQ